MIETYLIYSFVLLVSTSIAYGAFRANKYGGRVFILARLASLSPVVFVSGFRNENVGTDTQSYKLLFESIEQQAGWLDAIYGSFLIFAIEPGFTLLNWVLRIFNFDFSVALFVYSVIVWLPIYKSFDENKRELYFAVFVFITFGFLFASNNVVRQAIAISITFYSTRFLFERNYRGFCLLNLVASAFHISTVVAFLFPLVTPRRRVKEVFWILVVLFGYLLSFVSYDSVFFIFDDVDLYFKYSGYVNEFSNVQSPTVSVGAAYQFMLFLILLAQYRRTSESTIDACYFNLSFIGYGVYFALLPFPIGGRVSIIFLPFQAASFVSLFVQLRQRRRYLELISLQVLFFLSYLYKIYANDSGSAPYYF